MTWKALITQDWAFAYGGLEVKLGEFWNDRCQLVTKLESGKPPTLYTPETAQVGPKGLILPYDAAEPLRDALTVILGVRPDDYRAKYEEARDALEVERRRVDTLLEKLGHTHDEGVRDHA